MSAEAHIKSEKKDDQILIALSGEWTAATIDDALQKLNKIHTESSSNSIAMNLSDIEKMDTAAAWSLYRFQQSLQAKKTTVGLTGLSTQHQNLFDEVSQHTIEEKSAPPKVWLPLRVLENMGRKTCIFGDDILQLLQFIGELSICAWRSIKHPSRLRLRATIYHLEKVGFDALPIVGLISFLIGVVLVYQGAYQLRRFGAEIFTVDLLAVSALREIGILLTAIVVAGRSGSAFAAQIGFMKLNQEVDAMWVLGLNPFEVLVLPRLIALTIALPLLSFYSDLMALLGGGVMCNSLIDLDFQQFLHHAQLAIKPWTFWTGMIKAPVFAVSIAVIGCFEGMRVSGGAESVGERTTRAVVESIFLVIILDAIFSILYSYLGI